MNAKYLNTISRDVFSYTSKDGQNPSVKVNAANDTKRVIDRDSLIAAGRLATMEHFGRLANNDKNSTEKYNSLVDDYATFSRNTWVDTLLFCAAQANAQRGKQPYSTFDEVKRDLSLYKNNAFWATLQAIAEEVIYPLLPAVIASGTDRLITWDRVGLGETKIYDIESNDFFVFDDDSWGSVSSKPYQYLYKSQIALTPKAYTAKTKIKWYQDVVGGEAGRFYAAFARGAANKMFAITLEDFKKATAADSKYIPSNLVYDSFTQSNWNNALMNLAALNGVSRNQLCAIGTLAGLSQIVPTVGESGQIAGLQGEIGTEFARNGFLANVAGVDLIETGLAVVPGTQNYNAQFLSLDDDVNENVYILAKIGYAPMVGVIADGSPISIEFTPRETADMTIDISETLLFEVAPAFSSKIAKLTL